MPFFRRHLQMHFLEWKIENVWISLKISLTFVPKVLNNNIPALVQIMTWRRPGDKPLSETMIVSLLTHICVMRPQWVNSVVLGDAYMCHWTGSSLVQVMVSHLFSTKPLLEPMVAYCQLGPWEQNSAKFELVCSDFFVKKIYLKISSPKCQLFCLGLNGLNMKKWWHVIY